MKQYQLFVLENESELDTIKQATASVVNNTPVIVYWDSKFQLLTNETLYPFVFEKGQNEESKKEDSLAFEKIYKILEDHEDKIHKLVNIFNPTIMVDNPAESDKNDDFVDKQDV